MTDKKDIEFLVEEKKLEEVSNILNEEMLSYINKRKFVTQYILDYRKNAVEEYKDDEDKLIEYFDHERYVKEQAFTTIDKKLKELTILKESPYFGRVTFNDLEFDQKDTLYVGRFGVTPEGSYEPVIVDWRAPVASLFYHGSLGEASYTSPDGPIKCDIEGRRQIIVKKGELKGVFDSAIDVKDDILQMVLSNNSSDKLKDVIMTIQQEQDEIIRKERTSNIVVNGVAGSGKTTIALHRVAYLLYNYRKELEDKVIILGPNGIFMEYISQVLPSLGEVGVKQETFASFALKEMDSELYIMSFDKYLEKILSEDIEFIEDAKYKNSYEIIEDLDNLVKEMDKDYFHVEDVKYFGDLVISKEEIEEMFNKHYEYMPLFRRSEKIKRIILSKIKDKRDEKVWELNEELRKEKEKLTPEELLIEENNLEFRRKLRIREIVKEVMDSRAKLDRWISREDVLDIYDRFNGNKKEYTINDLAPILYLAIKLEGKKATKDYRHVVIDEAQDYSPLQFKVVRELTGTKYFTVVGDVNQRLIKYSDLAPMMELGKIFDDVNPEIYNLNKSYRSTYEIMEYANKYLDEDRIIPIVRHGKPVEEIEFHNDEELSESIIESLKEFSNEGLESIAIITRDKEELEKVYNLISNKVHLVKFDNEDVLYKGGNVIIPSYFAKGLEFDGVIIVDNGSSKDENEDLIKYIMSTRALHRLKEIQFK
ncbi:MAG: AAA family ATPase [Clostridium perfringens]|uniref:UvrD-like helicase ATP-binding domain-containing protein n=1 Tax=Clostridium perfringens (strain 13 / Type A) TaxID=195102 RepID=Q8XMT9_CLOPE|nr:UvrD-helicase domain-containing protein [Clostridium perfringens]EHR1327023.1 UvrD-helicase domain-containing protein [Clostridium perfringens]EHR1330155.1 UvrD-helicase domain-containing protein [Clostridium perfringens]EHR1423632.1 UvrD-helicase domain-containing protein [Clostridium perfringens]EIF6164190.1 UvrD-helicase domain-containing protein [Clostridium perfringens]MDU0866262.1 AAA family ATPase [Clostridium perfringens]